MKTRAHKRHLARNERRRVAAVKARARAQLIQNVQRGVEKAVAVLNARLSAAASSPAFRILGPVG